MSAEPAALALVAAAVFAAWMRAAAPIVFGALGALVSELAGVINVGIEGLMLVAAFFGVVGSAFVPVWFPQLAGWAPWVGAAAGLAAALLLAVLLGVFHLEFGADLIVAGIGLNLLAAGLTVFLMVTISGDKGSTASLASATLPSLRVPGLEAAPLLDAWINGEGGEGHHLLVYAAFVAVAATAWALRRTRFGLRLRAVGENPEAARAAGVPVKRVQYLALAASGLLAGLGGIYLSMGYLNLFQADMSAGRGFLALAAVFLGARRPLGTLGAALLFGASAVLAAQLGLLNVPAQALYMLPPIVTLLAMLVIAERRMRRERRALQRAAAAQAAAANPSSLAPGA
ncbi:MAG TPA: ABC transporter permease [Methylibium sp.]|uniref:ABC transporter permease n=1 Tax=Methylibium sp. TaxID=2067992 RepID=UPI002DBE0303|nr:ABC transporter permease [Methylibium sp.]HEU4460274.1 ABC transporter permease [Methylibium sp.]